MDKGPLVGCVCGVRGLQSLAQLLCEMRDVNKSLQFEVDDLKQKLKDSDGDVKVRFYCSSLMESVYCHLCSLPAAE